MVERSPTNIWGRSDPPRIHRIASREKKRNHHPRLDCKRFAKEGTVTVSWDRIWQIEPILFDQDLIALCDEAISETGAVPHRLPSGPLHDAAEVARAGVPTIMMFVQCLHGISHNKIEDTKAEHLELAVIAFDKLAGKAMQRIAAR